MGSDIWHLRGLDAHKPKCHVKNSEKILVQKKAQSMLTFLISLKILFWLLLLCFSFKFHAALNITVFLIYVVIQQKTIEKSHENEKTTYLLNCSFQNCSHL